jgi:glycosyltransferase involved in cell wall biosynthesis
MNPTNPTDSSNRLRILVGIPAYNEARSVGSIVLQAKQYCDEVIVVDDGSTDNTARIAGLAGACVVRHNHNEGYGAAVLRILAEAKKRNPRVLVLLDADSQHNPDEIPSLIRRVSEGFDVVIGSRQAQREKTPTYRRIGQKVLLRSGRLIERHDVSDSESGFRALSAKAIDELELKEKGFASASEMIVKAAEKGLRMAEVPISNIYTADGSTLNPIRHGVEVLNRILIMISRRRPLFFFGVLGSALLAAGLIIGLRVLNIALAARELLIGSTMLTVLFLVAGMLSVFTGIILNAVSKRD